VGVGVAPQGLDAWLSAKDVLHAAVERLLPPYAELAEMLVVAREELKSQADAHKKAAKARTYQQLRHAKRFATSGSSTACSKLASSLLEWSAAQDLPSNFLAPTSLEERLEALTQDPKLVHVSDRKSTRLNSSH